MRSILCLAVLAVAADFTPSRAQSPVPIPEGTTVGFTFPRPNSALPPEGKWVDGTGNPQGFEHDPITPDDPMGPASGVDPATIDVENKGGVLSGPNGKTLNGLGEGAVIEVKICWTYRYPVTMGEANSTTVEPLGMGGGSSTWQTWKEWREKKVCSTYVKATAVG